MKDVKLVTMVMPRQVLLTRARRVHAMVVITHVVLPSVVRLSVTVVLGMKVIDARDVLMVISEYQLRYSLSNTGGKHSLSARVIIVCLPFISVTIKLRYKTDINFLRQPY